MLSANHGFLPFSQSFLEEQMDFEINKQIPKETKNLSTKSKYQNPPSSSSQPKDSPKEIKNSKNVKFIKLDNLKFLIGLNDNEALYFMGFGVLNLVKGCIVIDGYKLRSGVEVTINRPVWMPAIRVSADYLSHPKEENNKKSAKEESFTKLLGCENCFIFTPSDQSDWLVSIEDKSIFEKKGEILYDNNQMTENNNISNQVNSTVSLQLGTGLLSVEHQLISRNIEVIKYPTSWTEALNNFISTSKESDSIKSLVCGSKGVGKSSFNRLLINSYLNIKRFQKICFIDCDLGQPELTLPGVISLHIIDTPLLSSSHLQLKTPLYSIFLGDNTSRHEPELFCQSLKILYSKYANILNEHIEEVKTQKIQTKLISKNRFSLLMQDEDELQNQKVNSNKIEASESIPLFINTDGFVRYMGAEILSAIAEIIEPTHIFHLASTSEEHLPITHVLQQQKQPWIVYKLEPGRSKPSKTLGADLRNLRFVSYFLRNNQTITEFQQLKDASKVTDLNRPIENLYINNGVIVADSGILSMSLLSLPPYIIPLNRIVFNSYLHALQPTTLFSLINNGIVGLSSIKISDLPDTTSFSLKLGELTNNRSIELKILSSFGYFNCIAQALVRCVDIQTGFLALTIPIRLENYLSDDSLLILTLSNNLKLPNYMLLGLGFPTFPYYSAEMTGNGSIQTKFRPNLKRKGQQKSKDNS